MWAIRAGIHKVVRIANGEDPGQTASSEAVSASVQVCAVCLGSLGWQLNAKKF